MGEEKHELIKEALRCFSDCNIHDWDGYRGAPCTINSLKDCLLLIAGLPDKLISHTEICPSPDGTIGLEISKPNNRLCITIHDNKIVWASIKKEPKNNWNVNIGESGTVDISQVVYLYKMKFMKEIIKG